MEGDKGKLSSNVLVVIISGNNFSRWVDYLMYVAVSILLEVTSLFAIHLPKQQMDSVLFYSLSLQAVQSPVRR